MDTKAAFEKWLTEGLDPNGLTAFMLTQKREDGAYHLGRVSDKWGAWQASRAAIEIEFPNLSDDKFCWSDGVFNLKEGISNKLTSHGIRIKGKTE